MNNQEHRSQCLEAFVNTMCESESNKERTVSRSNLQLVTT